MDLKGLKEVISQHGSLFLGGKNRDKEPLEPTYRVSETIDPEVSLLKKIQSSPSLVWREGREPCPDMT
jgi:hypothetical protein